MNILINIKKKLIIKTVLISVRWYDIYIIRIIVKNRTQKYFIKWK